MIMKRFWHVLGQKSHARGPVPAITILVLMTMLVAIATWSMMVGQYQLSVTEVYLTLKTELFRAFTHQPEPANPVAASTLLNIRLPRVLLGCVVGAGLAAAGAATQALFANPLAEPGIIGVSSGAALGASTSIALGWTALAPVALPISAFAGGVLATILVYWLSRSDGVSQVLTLVLTGIAINAVAGAGIALMTFVSSNTSREQIVFWQMGSLNGATWNAVATASGFIIAGLVLLVTLRQKLDLLALGESTAWHSGVNVERLRLTAILLVALLTGAAVSYAGIIGFIGLVIPHGLRLLLGPSNRLLIPLSALGGAVLLMAADILARTIIPFADLPIGIFTALVGGPAFFLLLRKTLSTRSIS